MTVPAEFPNPPLRVSFDSGECQLLPFDSAAVHDVIVPVVGWDGQELVCLGTGFAIEQNGIFVTARHVIDEWMDALGDRTHEGTAGLYIVYESDRQVLRPDGEPGTLGGLLAIGSASSHPDADLAVLHTQTPYVDGERVPFPILELTVALPCVGDRCVAIGYARMHLDGAVRPRVIGDTTLLSVDYDRQIAATRGIVEAVHPVQRDSFRLTWPCFLTDAQYDKGMSGSPVFDAHGKVIGIVCSSTPKVDDQPFTSYATLTASLLPLHLALAGDTRSTVVIADIFGSDIAGFDDIDVITDFDGATRLVYTDDAISRSASGQLSSHESDAR